MSKNGDRDRDGGLLYVGRRRSYGSSLCTVRYVGPVAGTEGTWLGVEWDDPEAGKHDGRHLDVRYFVCASDSPRAASFIRPARPADQPRSFLEALRGKYAPAPAAVADPSDDKQEQEQERGPEQGLEDGAQGAAAAAIRISSKLVEEVGFDKVRRQQAALQDLRVVLVDGQCVAGLVHSRPLSPSSSSPSSSLSSSSLLSSPSFRSAEWRSSTRLVEATCPRIVELDLSRSLLERWLDVVGLASALPGLRRLALNGNRFWDLSTPGAELEDLESAFRSVEELSLDSTFLEWDDLIDLVEPFRGLRSLSFAGNGMRSISKPLRSSKIQSLVLAGNPLSGLSSIKPLENLASLTTLSLRFCSISSLEGSEGGIPSLKILDLSNNEITSIQALSSLCTLFPSLSALQVAKNPYLATMTPEDGHMLTLARVPSLTELNHSRISAKERTNADLYYLSRIAAELELAEKKKKKKKDPQGEEGLAARTVLASHPQYPALCAKYGEPTIMRAPTDDAAAAAAADAERENPNTIAARLVTLTMRLAARPPRTEGVGETTTMVVPRTMRVSKLKSLVGRKLGVLPHCFRLVWETGEWDPAGATMEWKEGFWENWSSESEDGNDDDHGKNNNNDDNEDDEDDDDHGNDGKDQSIDAEGRHGKNGSAAPAHGKKMRKKRREGWVLREIELREGTKDLGFWIDGKRASIRVETL